MFGQESREISAEACREAYNAEIMSHSAIDQRGKEKLAFLLTMGAEDKLLSLGCKGESICPVIEPGPSRARAIGHGVSPKMRATGQMDGRNLIRTDNVFLHVTLP